MTVVFFVLGLALVIPAVADAQQDSSIYVIPDQIAALPGGDSASNPALCTQAESGGDLYLTLYAGNGGQGAVRWCDSLVAGDATVPVDPGTDLPHTGPEAVVSTCAVYMPDPGQPGMYSWGTVWSTPRGMDDAVDQCALLSAELTVTWRAGLQPADGEVIPVECADGWTTSRGAQPDACAQHGGVDSD